tara:strand:- start:209 stop:358 length:150 start_codon:yes stop_codon:yes gene_type:complete
MEVLEAVHFLVTEILAQGILLLLVPLREMMEAVGEEVLDNDLVEAVVEH